MDKPAVEGGEELGEQLAYKGERSRVRRVDGARRPPAPPFGPAVGEHGQWPVALVFQPTSHVPETVLVGDQLDVALAAEGVERPDLGGGEGAGIGPNVAVVGI